MKATRTATVVTILWGNGNTDVFASMDELEASYNDQNDETHQDARDLAESRTVEVGEEINTTSEEWSRAALDAVAAR